MKERYSYPAIFTYEKGQKISVEFPDLGCSTSGENDEDALISAKELLACVLFGLEEDKEEIPNPTSLEKIAVKSNERVKLIDVYMPLIRQASSNKTI